MCIRDSPLLFQSLNYLTNFFIDKSHVGIIIATGVLGIFLTEIPERSIFFGSSYILRYGIVFILTPFPYKRRRYILVFI